MIIMDEVFHLQPLRAQLETLCEKQGIEVLWVEVKCPYDLIEKRLKAKQRFGHILSTEESLKMNRLFAKIFQEFPAYSQNHIVINNESEDSTNIEIFC
jgi:predicted kinase